MRWSAYAEIRNGKSAYRQLPSVLGPASVGSPSALVSRNWDGVRSVQFVAEDAFDGGHSDGCEVRGRKQSSWELCAPRGRGHARLIGGPGYGLES